MTEDRELCHGPYAPAHQRGSLGLMTSFRVAESLDVMLGQFNGYWPDRDRASDGSIGDLRHCPGVSDHCPKDIPGLGSNVVTARDFDHDPAHGADMGEISEALRRARDTRLAYVIFNRRIFSSTILPWTWRSYDGSNPHDKHMHVSVVHAERADDTRLWRVTMSLTDTDVKKVTDAVIARVLNELPRALMRYDPNDVTMGVLNPYDTADKNPTIAVRTALHDTLKTVLGVSDGLEALTGQIGGLAGNHGAVMALLREIRDDPDNTISLTDVQLQYIADQLAQRLPTGGTFTLAHNDPPQ